MPIHDWTRVSAGTWHDFHVAWVAELQRVFNTGVLPSDYYSQAESLDQPQPAERVEVAIEEVGAYARKRRTIVVRHNSGDRIVALIELVSPGNKAARHALDVFVEKAHEALYRGYHLLIVDLFPNGIHGAIWQGLSDDPYTIPPDEPLTLVAYSAGQQKKAYIEPTAVGKELIEMPLFLTPDVYVNVPLEEPYGAAYRGVPRKWKAALES
jgi:hypothetical protein